MVLVLGQDKWRSQQDSNLNGEIPSPTRIPAVGPLENTKDESREKTNPEKGRTQQKDETSEKTNPHIWRSPQIWMSPQIRSSPKIAGEVPRNPAFTHLLLSMSWILAIQEKASVQR